jgi:ubiquinone/menaquinone biosynthesis C-methylase UbiE
MRCDQSGEAVGSIRQFRKNTVHGLQGRVLEIGCGHGDNFAHYRPDVRVIATDPSLPSLQAASRKRLKANCSVQLAGAYAEALPFSNQSFDAVVGTLVMCSVRNPHEVLKEVRRVLKPGGTLHLFEHVRSNMRLVAKFQDIMADPWLKVTGMCHLNRDTVATIQEEGFVIDSLRMHAGRVFLECVAHPA